MKKGDFLDFTKEHKLSEMECELITFFRYLPKEKKQAIKKFAYQLVVDETEAKKH